MNYSDAKDVMNTTAKAQKQSAKPGDPKEYQSEAELLDADGEDTADDRRQRN